MRKIRITIKNNEVIVSAPFHVKKANIENFINEKLDWINKHLEKNITKTDLHFPSDEAIYSKYKEILEKLLNEFPKTLKVYPKMSIKHVQSYAGKCFTKRNLIILNKNLIFMGEEVIRSVILHELVHFIHPNHQSGFYKTLLNLMPDYHKLRREHNKKTKYLYTHYNLL